MKGKKVKSLKLDWTFFYNYPKSNHFNQNKKKLDGRAFGPEINLFWLESKLKKIIVVQRWCKDYVYCILYEADRKNVPLGHIFASGSTKRRFSIWLKIEICVKMTKIKETNPNFDDFALIQFCYIFKIHFPVLIG